MKKFSNFFAAAIMAVCCFAACEKDNAGDQNGDGNNDGNNSGIIDDGGSSNTGLPASLKGSDYVVFFLGEDEYKAIEKKVSVNLMPNNSNIFVDVWAAGETYVGAETVGLNSYGFGEGWLSFSVVAPAGWSGGAIAYHADTPAPQADLSKIMTNPSEWYFHIAFKSDVPGQSHVISLEWAGTAYPMVLGANPGDFNDGKTFYPVPVSGEYKVGEWNEYEIPISQLGVKFNLPIAPGNLVSFLSGPTAGKVLNLDAIFIYKK